MDAEEEWEEKTNAAAGVVVAAEEEEEEEKKWVVVAGGGAVDVEEEEDEEEDAGGGGSRCLCRVGLVAICCSYWWPYSAKMNVASSLHVRKDFVILPFLQTVQNSLFPRAGFRVFILWQIESMTLGTSKTECQIRYKVQQLTAHQ